MTRFFLVFTSVMVALGALPDFEPAVQLSVNTRRWLLVITVVMTLTAPGCGMGEILVEDVREKVSIIPTVGHTDVELVFDPPWNREMMTEAAQLELGMI